MKYDLIKNGQIVLNPCDLCFSRGRNIISKGIRFFTRFRGESPSVVNHIFTIEKYIGYINETHEYSIIDTHFRVEKKILSDYRNEQIIICRDKTLKEGEKKIILNYMEKYIGSFYSPFKIAGQFLDGILGKITGRNHVFFTKIFSWDFFVICSYVVAKAWAYVGKSFGISAGVADPDDMLDFIFLNPEKWEVIFISDSILKYMEKKQDYYRKIQIIKGSLISSVFT